MRYRTIYITFDSKLGTEQEDCVIAYFKGVKEVLKKKLEKVYNTLDTDHKDWKIRESLRVAVKLGKINEIQINAVRGRVNYILLNFSKFSFLDRNGNNGYKFCFAEEQNSLDILPFVGKDLQQKFVSEGDLVKGFKKLVLPDIRKKESQVQIAFGYEEHDLVI
jgi:hypothetical protein